MNKGWITYLFIGLVFSCFPLHASFNKGGYQPLRNEEETDIKPKAKKVATLNEEKSLTEEVKPTIPPAYEQYLLYCTEKQMNGNIEDLKGKLAAIYINFPNESKFTSYLTSYYSYPHPLSQKLYHAIDQDFASPIRLFKAVSKFEPNKKKALSRKLERLYLQAEGSIKKTMLSLSEDSTDEIKLQTYKLGKLYYSYALSLDSSSEKRNLYLKKAKNQFNQAQGVKNDKIEKHRKAISHLLE